MEYKEFNLFRIYSALFKHYTIIHTYAVIVREQVIIIVPRTSAPVHLHIVTQLQHITQSLCIFGI